VRGNRQASRGATSYNRKMNTEFLDRLAEQLKRNKSAVCRRAITWIHTDMKERCKRDEFLSQSEGECIFRELVESEPACQKRDK
jgi:hypothetical protein